MELDSTWNTSTGYSRHSVGCTVNGSFREPESDSRPRNASSLATAAGSGPRAESEKVRHSSSRYLLNCNICCNRVVPLLQSMDPGIGPGGAAPGEATPLGTSSLRLDRFQR